MLCDNCCHHLRDSQMFLLLSAECHCSVFVLTIPHRVQAHCSSSSWESDKTAFMQTRGFPPIHNHLSLLFPWKTGGFRDLSPPIRGLQVYVEGNYSIWSQFPLRLPLSDQGSPEKWPKKSVLSVHSTSKNEEKKMANIQTFDGKTYFKPKTTGREKKEKACFCLHCEC